MAIKLKKQILPIIIIILFIYLLTLICSHKEPYATRLKKSLDNIFEEPIIFVGGYEGSGTSLMRSILDVHPEVKCGPETKVTTEVSSSLQNILKNGLVKQFMAGTQIKSEQVYRALGLFNVYLYVINNPNATRICSKEPNNSRYIQIYKYIFPKSKFIHMVRDGREAAHSVIRRWGGKKFDFKNFYDKVKEWNEWNSIMYDQCLGTGSDYCKIVKYEDLVLRPRETIEEIASFLGLKWTNKFLRHQEFLREDIKISKYEPSLSGIKHEINNNSLGNWVGKIQNYDENKMKDFKMLSVFGYLK